MIESMQQFLGSVPPWLYAILAGAAVASWSHIRSLASRALTHLVDRVYLDADLAAELMTHLSRNADVSRFGGRGYLVLNKYVRTQRKQAWLLARWLSKEGILTFWVKHPKFGIRLPVWVDRGKNGEQMTFRFLRGTLIIEDTLRTLVENVNNRSAGRYRVIRCVGTGRGSGGNDNNPRSLTEDGNGFTRLPTTAFFLDVDPDDLGTPTHQGGPKDLWWSKDSEEILEDSRTWSKRRQWYHDRGIPWRRGYLLHGEPGTGKTSVARAIAIDQDLPLYNMDLGSMDNSTMEAYWQQVRGNSPCLVLIEDIDSVYTGRKPVQANPQLGTPPTFDALLNAIDGADPNDGVVTIITTNNLDAVDVALSGRCNPDGTVAEQERPRPGRIDRVIKMPSTISREGRVLLAEKTLRDFPELVEKVVKEGANDTPAQFVERTITAAQERV